MKPEEIVKKLVSDYKAGKGIFSERINVEDFVPIKYNREQKARYLFYVVVLDYGMRSVVLYKGANKLYRDHPKLLNPNYFENINPNKLAKLIQPYLHARFPNEAAKRWIKNSKILISDFQGKAINIFKDKSAKKAAENIKSFSGFGNKTGHLFFRSAVNTLNLKYPDVDDIPMPIDRHKLRLTYEWKLITKKDFRSENRAKVSRLWKFACKKAGISWLLFDRAFWIYGSKISK